MLSKAHIEDDQIRGGVGEGRRGSDGRSPTRQRPQGHSPNRTQRGGSGGEMLHPPGHSAIQLAGNAMKEERSGGGWCYCYRKQQPAGTRSVTQGKGGWAKYPST